jgi:hypothetical protein
MYSRSFAWQTVVKWGLLHREAEPTDDSGHFREDIEELSIRVTEVFFEPVEGDDDPIGVAAFARPIGWCRLASGSLFGQRDALPGEAGSLSCHTPHAASYSFKTRQTGGLLDL